MVAERVGCKVTTIHNYSSRWKWSQRVAAWDAEQARAEDRGVLAAREAEAAESVTGWREVEDKALKALGEFSIETVRDALAVADRATHWRRIAEGEVTDRTEVREQLDLSKLSTEEVIEFRRLLRKARGE